MNDRAIISCVRVWATYEKVFCFVFSLASACPQTAMVSARELKGASLDVVVNILYKIIVEHRMPFQDAVPHNGQDLVCATISLRSAVWNNILMPQIQDLTTIRMKAIPTRLGYGGLRPLRGGQKWMRG